jgi:hypothetical protein
MAKQKERGSLQIGGRARGVLYLGVSWHYVNKYRGELPARQEIEQYCSVY